MPALTTQMRDDMQLRGLAARTQPSYLAAVEGLAKHYGRPFDALTDVIDGPLWDAIDHGCQLVPQFRDVLHSGRPHDLVVGGPILVRNSVTHLCPERPLYVWHISRDSFVCRDDRLRGLSDHHDLVENCISNRGIAIKRVSAAAGVGRYCVCGCDHVTHPLDGVDATPRHESPRAELAIESARPGMLQ
ncbi:MAG: hypothetical protein ABIV10_10380 [Gemmatimonadaceae bacterium]